MCVLNQYCHWCGRKICINAIAIAGNMPIVWWVQHAWQQLLHKKSEGNWQYMILFVQFNTKFSFHTLNQSSYYIQTGLTPTTANPRAANKMQMWHSNFCVYFQKEAKITGRPSWPTLKICLSRCMMLCHIYNLKIIKNVTEWVYDFWQVQYSLRGQCSCSTCRGRLAVKICLILCCLVSIP